MAQNKINKHGLNITNLRKICSMTKGMSEYTGYHIEIAWDPDTGKICYEEHVGSPGHQWVVWSEGMIPCGYLTRPMTQQDIADQVKESLLTNGYLHDKAED